MVYNQDLNSMVIWWTQLQIKSAELSFKCGGDSMEDTHLVLYGKDDQEIKDDDLDVFFDKFVYDNVEFYINSDGHYIGESGKVLITLENGKFQYLKVAKEYYNETLHNNVTITLVPHLLDYLKNVRDVEVTQDDAYFRYKEGSAIDKASEIQIEGIFSNTAKEHLPKDSDVYFEDALHWSYDECYRVELKSIEDNTVTLSCFYDYYVTKESIN
jgi:hypothetical protein